MLSVLFLVSSLFQAPTPHSPMAADAAPLAELVLIRQLSERADALQARLDLLQLGGSVWAASYIDGVNAVDPANPQVMVVEGWALACGYEDPRIVITVDGIEVPSLPAKMRRQDVYDAFKNSCNLTTDMVGVQFLLDLTTFEPGWNSDHRHTVQLHVYPPSWTSRLYPPFSMQKSSNMRTVQVQ
jgi:hypothetical protein